MGVRVPPWAILFFLFVLISLSEYRVKMFCIDYIKGEHQNKMDMDEICGKVDRWRFFELTQCFE
ncbi:hypothetical protein CAEBREN_03578 [Caenorhabditis brenneri]|uniref:Uncharacterized protein n=1 Tax=Caenorhabditis brenneri TaxID=135651 RepID=G0NYT0_CAEBE|nr:hypothetical protein CAEBREN_03578 [Caenorhabditis brenneri]